MSVRILTGDCRDVLKTLPDGSVHMVCTSPPYWGLRDYQTEEWGGGDPACQHVITGAERTPWANSVPGPAGATAKNAAGRNETKTRGGSCGKCGATRIDRQIGLEPTPAEYVATMVDVFREVWRVLRDDGTLWLNLGDGYNNFRGSKGPGQAVHGRDKLNGKPAPDSGGRGWGGLKEKDLLMMPARVALALQADGWTLRSDIIWCLSGGTRVYARTQKGEMPMTIKDMVRLDPDTVQLWNGEKWTQVLGWNEAPRPDRTYEIELRNGQRIGCTAGHEWPVEPCGNIRTDELKIGDTIRLCRLPEPINPRQPAALDDEMVGWFVGLYIAEGSQSNGTIQIASHIKEDDRFARLDQIAAALHGTARLHKTSQNGCTINLNGPMLNGLVDTYVSGRIAKDKHLHPRCWQRSDRFLRAVLDGYLSGDGHWHEASQRWRLGFCNNDELVADLRTLAARLGVSIHLRRVMHKLGEREFPGYKGDLRLESLPKRRMPDGQVVAIRESRARKFWHIGVEDEPHLFALSSGILTSNSKPNPMPESVRDRPTTAHEHVFLLTKGPKYFYDATAIEEDAVTDDMRRPYGSQGAWELDGRPVEQRPNGKLRTAGNKSNKYVTEYNNSDTEEHRTKAGLLKVADKPYARRNKRSVWWIATHSFAEAHFATFPPALIEPCILAGTSERGCCRRCGAPWVRKTEVTYRNPGNRTTNGPRSVERRHETAGFLMRLEKDTATTGWLPSCSCAAGEPVPCTVLDPFGGAGTTALVSDRLQRDCILVELNPEYATMAESRLRKDGGLFANIEATEVAAE